MSRFRLPQKITYWLKTGNNGTGGGTYDAGVVVAARIATVDEQVFTGEGKQVMARKAVYTRVNIPTGSQIIEAEHSGVAAPVKGSQLVIKASNNPTMSDMSRALL